MYFVINLIFKCTHIPYSLVILGWNDTWHQLHQTTSIYIKDNELIIGWAAIRGMGVFHVINKACITVNDQFVILDRHIQ